jgi:alkanesulfonate monooxygenase SsuD/methylene tetrahydromethanopterin reductase-like flavin-dependent oxidoreductase (luciferase family)
MQFAVNVPTSGGASEYSSLPYCDGISWDVQREFGTAVEDLGFDGLSVPDHLMTGDGATTEAVVTLTGLAGVTEDVYLYPKTLNDQLRHGPLLAAATATLDNVSDGRLKLGIGAGWKEDEAVAFGYDWPDAPTRLRRLEETVEVVKRLWTEESVDYDGRFYTLSGANAEPFPTQEPHPPVMIGGGGEEFTLRIAAKHADTWNFWGPTHVMSHKLDVLRAHCDTYDTDFDAIEASWFTRCIVRETDEEVEAVLEDAPRFRNPDDLSELEDGDYHYLVGTPAELVETVESFEALGIEETVLEFVDFPGTEGAELFADEVIPEFS